MRNIFSLIFAMFATIGFALPQTLNNPVRIGSASFSYLGVELYTAQLFTENGQAFSYSKPLILEITYSRSISKSRLVEASLSEMARMGNARPDLAANLSNCFRDVGKGDRFAAVGAGSNRIDIYFNDSKTCSISSAGVSRAFLGIWLSDNSRDPDGSRRLRGL